MSECQVPSDTSLRTSGYYGRIKGEGKIDFRVRIRQRLTSGRIRQRERDCLERYPGWVLLIGIGDFFVFFLLVIHTHM
jgi:hypothetical protein